METNREQGPVEVMARVQRARAGLMGAVQAAHAAGLTPRQIGHLAGLKATTVRLLMVEWEIES